MLKNIPNNISPELLKILCEMGHSDEIVIGDGNFPAASNAKRLVRCDGQSGTEILEAVLQLFPLDQYGEQPVSVMDAGEFSPPIWDRYKEIVKVCDDEKYIDFEKVERFKFYERAKEAYAIIATSEAELYANIILRKGVIK
ncbi:MAG: RbsD/FucU family protein [Fusobacteriaceae bacterium]